MEYAIGYLALLLFALCLWAAQYRKKRVLRKCLEARLMTMLINAESEVVVVEICPGCKRPTGENGAGE